MTMILCEGGTTLLAGFEPVIHLALVCILTTTVIMCSDSKPKHKSISRPPSIKKDSAMKGVSVSGQPLAAKGKDTQTKTTTSSPQAQKESKDNSADKQIKSKENASQKASMKSGKKTNLIEEPTQKEVTLSKKLRTESKRPGTRKGLSNSKFTASQEMTGANTAANTAGARTADDDTMDNVESLNMDDKMPPTEDCDKQESSKEKKSTEK